MFLDLSNITNFTSTINANTRWRVSGQCNRIARDNTIFQLAPYNVTVGAP
jgi:hypothetical protein